VIRTKTTWVRKTAIRTLKSGEVVEPLEGSIAMIENLIGATGPAMLTGAWRAANAMQRFAQQNAPWTDRTGEARKNLRGYAGLGRNGQCWCAAIEHGPAIDYGVWLETRWNGRYAIVAPTQEAFAPRMSGYMKRAIDASNRGQPVPDGE